MIKRSVVLKIMLDTVVINSLVLFIGGAVLIKVYKNILIDSQIPNNLITEINDRSLGFFTVILVVLILVLIAASYFTIKKTIIKPIKTLYDGTKIISKGNLDYKVRVNPRETSDEIDQLSDAFDEMTSKLKDSYSGLEQKIAEKTKDLSDKIMEINRKNEELELFNKIAIDREMKMLELKDKIKELESRSK